MSEKVSRRSFLKTGCIVGAAAGLTICGGGTLAATYRPKIERPALTLGQGSPQVLVGYATKAGSTAETALRIGEVISKTGRAADVRPISEVSNLNAYQAVILGSAIYMGKVMPEVTKFLEDNQAALNSLPCSVFVLCSTLAEDTPANRAVVSAYLDPVRALVRPTSEGLFAGAINPQRMTLLERLITQSMSAPTGDFRDWDAIEAWAAAAVPD